MAGYSEQEITEGLSSLPGWQYDGSQIARKFEFDTFLGGIEFVRRVAEAAEAADHHPDIDIRYSSIAIAVSSHDVGGITDRDFRLAAEINALV